jgi:hypothetical protein
MERVSRIKTGTIRPPEATMTSGLDATTLAAWLRTRSILSAGQRPSNWILLPSVHPSFPNSSLKARRRESPSLSPFGKGITIPMRRIAWACCARAASGHAAAPPPRSEMNSRRFIAALTR